MTEPPVAVTGATGRLGSRVARRLAERGVPQRLLVRTPERAPALPGATPVRAEYGDHDAVVRTLDGVATVLMVSASESPDRLADHRTFVDAAVEAGVRHLGRPATPLPDVLRATSAQERGVHLLANGSLPTDASRRRVPRE